MNIVGMVQCNRSGAPDTKVMTKKMKTGTYKTTMWQHSNNLLVFAAWGDNSVVKTPPNCHGPVILPVGEGVSWKRKGDDGRRERESMEVSCAKRKRSYNAVMSCKQCSAKAGSNVWLCSGQKGDDVLPCHINYHKRHFNKEFPSTMGG